MSRVIQGSVRITNLRNEPVSLAKYQHIAQIRPVVCPSQLEPREGGGGTYKGLSNNYATHSTFYRNVPLYCA